MSGAPVVVMTASMTSTTRNKKTDSGCIFKVQPLL